MPRVLFEKIFKNMFLDAIGEDRNSPRRNAHQGMWHKHVLNNGTDREIEVGPHTAKRSRKARLEHPPPPQLGYRKWAGRAMISIIDRLGKTLLSHLWQDS